MFAAARCRPRSPAQSCASPCVEIGSLRCDHCARHCARCASFAAASPLCCSHSWAPPCWCLLWYLLFYVHSIPFLIICWSVFLILLPTELERLQNLVYLDLSYCNLSDESFPPSSLRALARLTHLEINMNQLSGQFTESVSVCLSNLRVLELGHSRNIQKEHVSLFIIIWFILMFCSRLW